MGDRACWTARREWCAKSARGWGSSTAVSGDGRRWHRHGGRTLSRWALRERSVGPPAADARYASRCRSRTRYQTRRPCRRCARGAFLCDGRLWTCSRRPRMSSCGGANPLVGNGGCSNGRKRQLVHALNLPARRRALDGFDGRKAFGKATGATHLHAGFQQPEPTGTPNASAPSSVMLPPLPRRPPSKLDAPPRIKRQT